MYKALSIVAPQGANIVSGRKTVEVRTWQPPTLPLIDLLIVENDLFLRNEGEVDRNGRAVALVDVTEVRPWTSSDLEPACSENWAPGYFAWQLENVRPILDSPKITAERGLFEVKVESRLRVGGSLSKPRST